jgi:hypothetical protein
MKKVMTVAILVGLIAAGCKKDVIDEPLPNPGNVSNSSLAAFFSNNAPAMQTFTVNAAQYTTVTGQRGTKITVYPNAFLTQANQQVSGNVTLKLQEVYSKKDIILSGASTVADGKPLISGGEINLTAWQGNNELKLNPAGMVLVKMPAVSSTSMAMNEFYASRIDSANDFTAPDTSQFINMVQDSFMSVTFFDFRIDSLNWINCDRFYYMGGQQTSIRATLPAQFNETNCKVFISFNGLHSAASLYSVLPSGQEFSPGPYYTLQVGMPVTFVALAEINGQFYSAFQSTTITNNHNEIMNLQQATEAQINQQLNALQ